MRILGIDPGIALVGWGVLEYTGNKFKVLGYGSIQTPSTMATEDRLCAVYSELKSIIDKYSPDQMAIEELFWNTNQKTGIRVSEARGVILMCGRMHGLEIHEYTPLQVKQSVVGYGRAEKKQVISMVARAYLRSDILIYFGIVIPGNIKFYIERILNQQITVVYSVIENITVLSLGIEIGIAIVKVRITDGEYVLFKVLLLRRLKSGRRRGLNRLGSGSVITGRRSGVGGGIYVCRGSCSGVNGFAIITGSASCKS